MKKEKKRKPDDFRLFLSVVPRTLSFAKALDDARYFRRGSRWSADDRLTIGGGGGLAGGSVKAN